jgi:hypothetical protein
LGGSSSHTRSTSAATVIDRPASTASDASTARRCAGPASTGPPRPTTCTGPSTRIPATLPLEAAPTTPRTLANPVDQGGATCRRVTTRRPRGFTHGRRQGPTKVRPRSRRHRGCAAMSHPVP